MDTADLRERMERLDRLLKASPKDVAKFLTAEKVGMKETQLYFSCTEVASILGISTRMVQYLVSSGELPAIKIAKKLVRIYLPELLEFLTSRHTRKPTKPKKRCNPKARKACKKCRKF